MVAALHVDESTILAPYGMTTPEAFKAVGELNGLKEELGFGGSFAPKVAYAGNNVLVTLKTDGSDLANAAAKAFLMHPKVAAYVRALPGQLGQEHDASSLTATAVDMGVTTAALATGGFVQGNLPSQQGSSVGLKLS